MSEFLQNDPQKQETLKKIIKRLHDGEPVENVRREFGKLIKNVAPDEIVAMEQALIREGLPVQEVQRLCDVHVDVFKSAMTAEGGKSGNISGHPVRTYREENKVAKRVLKSLKKRAKALAKGSPNEGAISAFADEWATFREIEKHYARKENQLCPYLERVGFTGPSQVMWGKHDEIRTVIKNISDNSAARNWSEMYTEVKELTAKVKRMIFMEEKILFPNALKKLSDDVWVAIRRGESEIGYAWITPGDVWDANLVASQTTRPADSTTTPTAPVAPELPASPRVDTSVSLDTGALTPERLNLMLKNLPVDVTYVDENDKVLYYSASAHRVFPRSPAIIGRDVQNCHPHKSVDVVNRIVESFRKKEKNVA
ncbi:MAG: DUF438 domain-containing protein [Spirochaetaceae bacterium]|nr:MAG: DUF438 domain-containing protein [Spirochaetaceae bacterium]